MTHAATSPGLSNTAPNAWTSAYPSSPPSWIDPGVGTLTWLGTPDGVENCRKSRRMPATPGATSGYTSE